MNPDPWNLIVGFEAGHAVAYHPATGTRARVQLRKVAKRMERRGQVRATPKLMQTLSTYSAPATSSSVDIDDGADDFDGDEEVGDDDEDIGNRFGTAEVGAFGDRIKKAAKKVAKVAKKVVKNKVVSALYGAVKAAVPPPYNAAVAAAETGVRFAGKLASSPKHRKALPLLQAAALGKGPTNELVKRAAKRAGIPVEEAKQVAVAIKTRAAAAKGDKRAAAVVAATERIEKARGGDAGAARSAVAMAAEAKLRSIFPAARVVRVTGPDGRQYLSAVLNLS